MFSIRLFRRRFHWKKQQIVSSNAMMTIGRIMARSVRLERPCRAELGVDDAEAEGSAEADVEKDEKDERVGEEKEREDGGVEADDDDGWAGEDDEA